MKNKITKRGLELLKQRCDFPADLPILLEQLPPIASLFFKHYNTGTYQQMFGNGEYVELINVGKCGVALHKWFEAVYIGGIKYENSIYNLIPANEILFEFSNYQIKKEEWHESGLIKIGYMAHWDIILLGVEPENEDEIWVIGEGTRTNKPQKCSENIFEFMSNVYEYLTDEDLLDYTKSSISGAQLYQNWGEDFWRIR